MGQVSEIDPRHGYKVVFLENSGKNSFKWSSREPKFFKDILFVVGDPCPANSRSFLKFADADYSKFN